MNVEQIEKQLEWLEKERREDKQVISSLKKQIASLEEKLEQTHKDIQALETEQTKFGVRITKMDSYDDALAAHRKEVKKEIDAQETRTKKRESYAKEKYDKQFSELSKEIIRVNG